MVVIIPFLAIIGCNEETTVQRVGSALLVPSVSIDPIVHTAAGDVSTGLITPTPEVEQLSISLTDNAGRYSKTWGSLGLYPEQEPLRPGAYLLEVFYGAELEEGFDSPYFYGASSVELPSGATVSASVTCRLANTMVGVSYTDDFLSYFPSGNVVFHSHGGGYISYPRGEMRPLYLRPGNIDVILDLTMPTGEQMSVLTASMSQAIAGHYYTMVVDVIDSESSQPEIVVTFDDLMSIDVQKLKLSPELLASEVPMITPVGFNPNTSVVINEGEELDTPIGFDIIGSDIKSVILTTQSSSLLDSGWPIEVDLLNDDLLNMEALGLEMHRSVSGLIERVDLTRALKNLRSSIDGANVSFTLVATSKVGKQSEPLILNIDVRPVEIVVLSVSDVIIGINKAQMKILAEGADLQSGLLIEVRDHNQKWQPTAISNVSSENGIHIVTFSVPDNTSAIVDIKLSYFGAERASFTLKRVSPKYTLDVDAYALVAVVRVNAEDPAMLETIASLVNIYIDGVLTKNIRREPDKGYVLVGGLVDNKQYAIQGTLFDESSAVGNLTSPVYFNTEKTLQIENGGFEKIDRDGISYSNMPSGGRYSQTIVDIFNQQNYTTFKYHLPENWANTNAKTFNSVAENKNTWYMHPSVYTVSDCFEGAYAVVVQTTAWDLKGASIPDYRQQSSPYLRYNPNIPYIAHRAAGKIFLGEYGFDPRTKEEYYMEGIDFTSRPAALNGYYKFLPSVADMSDCGVVRIEVIGTLDEKEVVIATGLGNLQAATSYTAFSVPLTYVDFGVKATRLKLLISSSKHIGTIAEESSQIITFNDPISATSLGGQLWIDGLTFSY